MGRRVRWKLRSNPNMVVETVDRIMDESSSESRENMPSTPVTFGDTSIMLPDPSMFQVPRRVKEPDSPKVKKEPLPSVRSSSLPPGPPSEAIPRMSDMPDHLVLEYMRRIIRRIL